jgi:hypothetical protein
VSTHRETGCLLAIAQGGVEDRDPFVRHGASASLPLYRTHAIQVQFIVFDFL